MLQNHTFFQNLKKQTENQTQPSKVSQILSNKLHLPLKKITPKPINNSFKILQHNISIKKSKNKRNLLTTSPILTSKESSPHHTLNPFSRTITLIFHSQNSLSTMTPPLAILFFSLHVLSLLVHSFNQTNPCRSFCGNLTIDYPFAIQPGCGHQGFRDLLFCINDVVMLHISSGSYRVLDIDYAYESLILHDPHMSTCDSIVLGRRGNGFVVEPWRAPHLSPSPDNVFMLLGCSSQSPLFQGFPGKHMPCRNVSGLGCDEYYNCPAWDIIDPRRDGPVYRSGPPDCCSMPYESVRSVNLSRLDCQGYSSAYSVAPLKVSGPGQWAYGIQVKYSVQGNEVFCRACEATGGSCGYDIDKNSDL